MTTWQKLRWTATGALGRRLLAVWLRTCRTKVRGLEEYARVRSERKPVIFLIWHGRLLIAPYFFRKRAVAALVSPSRDGEFIARIGAGWGFRLIRGSSSHSMVRAWAKMKQELGRGGELIIVPDGPRGPDRRLKPGALKLARDTGALLVPFSYSSSRKRFLKSWDRFLLVYPFSRIVAIYGKPIAVPAGADDEALETQRRDVARARADLEAEADSYFDKSPGVFVSPRA
jgi:lysophospholipid acyltransferase (LPLAT)-like uncharacterized protein